jgi:hypothetical protein
MGYRHHTSRVEGKATAMNGGREKEKVKRNGPRGQLRRYEPLAFSRFTVSKNAAGGFFNRITGEQRGDSSVTRE